MERLGPRDLDALLGCVANLYELVDVPGFARRLIEVLPPLIPAEHTLY